MSASPSVVSAATALAEWARVHRRAWSDVPLDVPVRVVPPVAMVAPVAIVASVAVIDQPLPVAVIDEPFPVAVLDEVVEPIEEPAVVVEPPMFAFDTPVDVEPEEEAVPREPVAAVVWSRLNACGVAVGAFFAAAFERLEPLGEPAMRWMIRGAALASIGSVLLILGINRGSLFDRGERMAAMVVAAANRPPIPPPPPVKPLAAGMGRLIIGSSKGAIVFVDGTVHGPAPVTLDLPAGPHRVLLRSDDGSVERTVRVQAAETGDVNEEIYPGWVALTTTVDLSLSENGRALKRDERGWAILPPGPHDIHLDNNALGVHEVRHVVVMPGDTTRLSFAAHTSTISLTTNEVAEVWIDGTSYGQAPLVDQPLSIGVHDVRVRSSAHERWLRVRATVQPLTVNVDLTAAN